MTRLSIITINYNGAQDTMRLLHSLGVQTDTDFDIFVVDNGSDRRDAALLERYINQWNNPRLAYIQNARNTGFSGGNNAAIRLALLNGSEWLFLLNNDTQLESTSIERIKGNLSFAGGIIGVPLTEGEQTAYCGRVRWLKATLRHIYRPETAQKLLARDEVYIIGGGMLVHADVFAKIGLFDERYFLYFEDADMTRRARKAGFDLYILSDIKARHRVQSSTKKLGPPLLLRYHFRNAHLFNLKHAPWTFRFLLPFWSAWILFKQFVKLFVLPHRMKYSLAIAKGVFDFYLGRWGKLT